MMRGLLALFWLSGLFISRKIYLVQVYWSDGPEASGSYVYSICDTLKNARKASRKVIKEIIETKTSAFPLDKYKSAEEMPDDASDREWDIVMEWQARKDEARRVDSVEITEWYLNRPEKNRTVACFMQEYYWIEQTGKGDV